MKSARKGEQRVALPEIFKRQCPSVLTQLITLTQSLRQHLL
jgi:hypothetical protein